MKYPPGFKNNVALAPQAGDSLQRLLEKAEGTLWYLRENETLLRKFPTGLVDERRALWQPLVELLRAALADPSKVVDAKLEAQRVWAEEKRVSAWYTVTECVNVREPAAVARFEREGAREKWKRLIDSLEVARPAAMKLLNKEDLDVLRERGFLRPGE